MTLLFCDGFDHYTTNAQLLTKWTSNVSGTAAPSAGNGRNSTASLRSSSNASISKSLGVNSVTLIGGMAFKESDRSGAVGILMEFRDGATVQVGCYANTDGTIVIKRNGAGGTALGTSTYAIPLGSWIYIEFKATIDNAGTAEVRVNGTSVVSASGDTQQSANAYAGTFVVGMVAASTACDIDDVYVCNGLGTRNNDYLGDIRIETLFANGAGYSTQWAPVGAANNYQCIDETTPNDDTDYVATSGAAYIDSYTFADLISTSGTIMGIQSCLRARKDDAGSRTVQPLYRPTSTTYSGTIASLGNSYLYYMDIQEVNPETTAAWTISEINGSEFGVKLVT